MRKGQDAEARQNSEAAYDFFKQAYDLKPKDLRYRTAFERPRFEAAASIVHRGQKLREDGKLDEPLPCSRKPWPSIPRCSSPAGTRTHGEDDHRPEEPSAPGCRPANQPGAARSMSRWSGRAGSHLQHSHHGKDDRDRNRTSTYRTIGQLAGINVLFDPDYTARIINVDLNGVTLEEALEITALESKTFWRPVTPNTIFVAQDNPAKRKELEQSVLKTFYLTNLSQPTELQDVVNAIRAVLDVQRVQQLLSQNALIVRGTPDQIALAEKAGRGSG